MAAMNHDAKTRIPSVARSIENHTMLVMIGRI
jgi:hypothetical protein